MPGVVTAYQTGIHSARPANGAGCILYSCTTHGLIYRDDGTTWTTYATLGLGAAPDSADYLVGTANGSLSAEIVVGTTPGGELGGTWGSPTVDATHSGSSHAGLSGQPGSTDVAVADGGTGSSTAAGARTNLGLGDLASQSNPMTTAADLIVGGASGVLARLAKGSDGQVLTVDPTTHLLVWATPSGGFSNPMTTKGDVIVGDTGGSPIRKAVGSDGQVLTADAASTGGIKWAAGAGGGVSFTRPALFPATPTYPFDSSTLDAAFAAHSNGGSFMLGDVISNGYDWGGSAVELEFSAQFGGIYLTHANTDLDFEIHGLRAYGFSGNAIAFMAGIAGLDSSGAGICSLVYNDGTAYLASVAAYNYTGNTDSWAGHGAPNIGGSAIFSDICLRIKRISGTWTGYASHSGRVWDKTFSTRADSVTVDRLYFGLLYNTASTYSGRLTADAIHVTT